MLEVDTTQWKAVGETSNTKYFEVEPDILAAVPDKGSSDNGAVGAGQPELPERLLAQGGSRRRGPGLF